MEARSLTDREREIFEQARTAAVVEKCGCGYLAVDDGHSEAKEARQRIVSEARTPEEREGLPLELILFAKSGRLSSIEIVYYDENIPREFPSPVEFQPAYARTD